MQINLLVLDRTPESFNQDIVDVAPSSRSANPDAFCLQLIHVVGRGELKTLV
jgi:hypothetical protein